MIFDGAHGIVHLLLVQQAMSAPSALSCIITMDRPPRQPQVPEGRFQQGAMNLMQVNGGIARVSLDDDPRVHLMRVMADMGAEQVVAALALGSDFDWYSLPPAGPGASDHKVDRMGGAGAGAGAGASGQASALSVGGVSATDTKAASATDAKVAASCTSASSGDRVTPRMWAEDDDPPRDPAMARVDRMLGPILRPSSEKTYEAFVKRVADEGRAPNLMDYETFVRCVIPRLGPERTGAYEAAVIATAGESPFVRPNAWEVQVLDTGTCMPMTLMLIAQPYVRAADGGTALAWLVFADRGRSLLCAPHGLLHDSGDGALAKESDYGLAMRVNQTLQKMGSARQQSTMLAFLVYLVRNRSALSGADWHARLPRWINVEPVRHGIMNGYERAELRAELAKRQVELAELQAAAASVRPVTATATTTTASVSATE